MELQPTNHLVSTIFILNLRSILPKYKVRQCLIEKVFPQITGYFVCLLKVLLISQPNSQTHTYMDQLVLRVVLLAAALPVAVGFINGLGLLFAFVPVHVVLQVQQAAMMVLWRSNIREHVLN